MDWSGWLRIRLIGQRVGKARLTFEVLHVDGHHLVRSDPLTGDRWTRVGLKRLIRPAAEFSRSSATPPAPATCSRALFQPSRSTSGASAARLT